MPQKYGDAAKMIRADLATAREAWLRASTLPQDAPERGPTGFPLAPVDDAGRVVDFHALRHTCGSLLAASGAHPKVAQSIMRHSTIARMMNRYSHVFAGQEADAIGALPGLSAKPADAVAELTGTDYQIVCADVAPGRDRNHVSPDSLDS